MAVTAKVKVNSKSGEDPVTVYFLPDYADDRNKEWASATPSLNLTMTMVRSVADQFEPGAAYTLTFEKSDDQPASTYPDPAGLDTSD